MTHVHVATDYANVRRSNYKALITVPSLGSPLTQVSGTLTAIAIAGGQGYHYFKVTIDGNLVVDEALCGGGAWMHNSIGLNLPFSRSLKVEIADYTPRFC